MNSGNAVIRALLASPDHKAPLRDVLDIAGVSGLDPSVVLATATNRALIWEERCDENGEMDPNGEVWLGLLYEDTDRGGVL